MLGSTLLGFFLVSSGVVCSFAIVFCVVDYFISFPVDFNKV
jgi:hypothetical protein